MFWSTKVIGEVVVFFLAAQAGSALLRAETFAVEEGIGMIFATFETSLAHIWLIGM